MSTRSTISNASTYNASLWSVHQPRIKRINAQSFRRVDEEVTYVGGRKKGQAERLRHEIKVLSQELQQSLLTTFSENVWEACEVPHPIVEKKKVEEKRQLQRRETMRKISRDLISGVGGWGSDKIPTMDVDAEAMAKERELASISSSAGLSLLDMEELQEVWVRHCGSLGGQLDMKDGSTAAKMVRELYVDAAVAEISRIHALLVKVRSTRGDSPASSRRGSATGYYGGPEQRTFSFSDFAIAFGKWLGRQEPLNKMRRCTLTTFKLTAVDRFRKELNNANPREAKSLVNTIAKQLASGERQQSLVSANDLQAENMFDLQLHVSNIESRFASAEGDSTDSSTDDGSSWGSEPECAATSVAGNLNVYERFKSLWREEQKRSSIPRSQDDSPRPEKVPGRVRIQSVAMETHALPCPLLPALAPAEAAPEAGAGEEEFNVDLELLEDGIVGGGAVSDDSLPSTPRSGFDDLRADTK